MPRRTSRPAGGRRPAPRRAAPSRSSSSSARRPAPPPAKAGAAPPPAKGAAPAQAPSAMGGFMSNVASTGLGVMAGRALDRTFFGGGGGGGEAPAEGAPMDGMPASAAMDGSAPYGGEYAMSPDEVTPSICAREVLEFKRCMERSASDLATCQWNLDILGACQQKHQQTGFADAGRF